MDFITPLDRVDYLAYHIPLPERQMRTAMHILNTHTNREHVFSWDPGYRKYRDRGQHI